MSARASASSAGKRQVRLLLTLVEPRHCGGTLECGLQTGKDELDFGTPATGGGVRYEAEVKVGTRPDGTPLYSGAVVNGPARERFVYLSYRDPGTGAGWSRRCKIPLPEQLEPNTAELSATVVDVGRSWAEFDGWRQA